MTFPLSALADSEHDVRKRFMAKPDAPSAGRRSDEHETGSCAARVAQPLSDRRGRASCPSHAHLRKHKGRSRSAQADSRAPRHLRGSLRRRRFDRRDRGTETPAFAPRRIRATACAGADLQPCFRSSRGLSAAISNALLFATCATGRLAGHPGLVSDRSADLLCRGCGSRGCACWEPDPRRLASARRCRSPGRAVTERRRPVAATETNGRSVCGDRRRSRSQAAERHPAFVYQRH